MRRIIHKIRLQPPEFRVMVAVIASCILTAIIAIFWASTLSVGTFQREQTDTTPGPISSLVSNIKNTIQRSRSEQNPLAHQGNTVQVIDATPGTSVGFDETNPASTTTQ